MLRKCLAEFIGTFWLVLGGCGSAVLAAKFPEAGIGFAGVALAFGLTVLTGAYALGPISGGHFPARHIAPYIVVQVAGAIVAAAVLYAIASGKPGFDASAGFAANGYGEHSPGHYSLGSSLICELVMTFMFVLVILGATHTRAPVGFAGLAIGLALFDGSWALGQLWLFWLAPLVGGLLAGVLYRTVLEHDVVEPAVEGQHEPSWRPAH
jgi:aquaporin Z